MTDLDKQIETLISERNDFEADNKKLNAKLELIKRKWEDAQGDISTLFEVQPLNMNDNSYQVDGQCVNDLMKAITQQLTRYYELSRY